MKGHSLVPVSCMTATTVAGTPLPALLGAAAEGTRAGKFALRRTCRPDQVSTSYIVSNETIRLSGVCWRLRRTGRNLVSRSKLITETVRRVKRTRVGQPAEALDLRKSELARAHPRSDHPPERFPVLAPELGHLKDAHTCCLSGYTVRAFLSLRTPFLAASATFVVLPFWSCSVLEDRRALPALWLRLAALKRSLHCRREQRTAYAAGACTLVRSTTSRMTGHRSQKPDLGLAYEQLNLSWPDTSSQARIPRIPLVMGW